MKDFINSTKKKKFVIIEMQSNIIFYLFSLIPENFLATAGTFGNKKQKLFRSSSYCPENIFS